MDAQVARRRKLNELLDTTKGKTYFVLFATFLFVAVMILFGLLPSYSALQRQSELNSRRGEHITGLQEKLATMENLVVENQAKSDIKGVFNSILPNGFRQLDYIYEITEFAEKYSMNFDGLAFSTTSTFTDRIKNIGNDRSLKAVVINMQLDGTKESITHFIRDLESSIRLYNIIDITVSKKPVEELLRNPSNPYRYSVVAHTYYFSANP